MATKGGGGGGDTVHTASVDVVANISVDEASLAEAQSKIEEALGKDATPRSESRSKAAKAVRDAVPKTVDVEAKVKANAKNVNKDVQDALDDQYEVHVKVDVDTKYLRQQLDNFFAQTTFTARVNLESATGEVHARLGVSHGAAVSTGTPRAPIPENVRQAMTPVLREGFNQLYSAVNKAFEDAGRGRFGTQPLAKGNEIEKATELISQFGSKFSDLIAFEPGSPVPRPTGGSLSPQELGKMLGLDPSHPALRSVLQGALSLTSTTDDGIRSSGADLVMTRLAQWLQEAPAPAAAPEQVAQAVMNAVKQEGGGTAAPAAQMAQAVAEATPALDRLQQAVKTLRVERGRIPFQDASLAIPARQVENKGVRRPDDDPEATAKAASQLLRNQRGGRGLIGRFAPRNIGGIDVDVEDLLERLRLPIGQEGSLSGFFEKPAGTARVPLTEEEIAARPKSGKGSSAKTKVIETPPRLIQLQPKTEEEQLRAAAVSSGSSRVATLEGIGRVERLGPTEALRRAIVERYDEAIAQELFSDPEFKNLVRLSAEQGARPAQLVVPGAPVAGSGERGGVISSSGHGFEGGYRAAYRLMEVQDELAKKYKRLEDLQGSGKPTDKLEQQIARLEAQESRLIEEALPITGVTPEQARVLAAAEREKNLKNQADVAAGKGLDQEEYERRVARDPKVLGRADLEMFAGTDYEPGKITAAIDKKLNDPEWVAGQTGGTNAIIGQAIKEVLEPLRANLPDKGPIRHSAERFLFPEVYHTYFGKKERVMRSNVDDSRGTMTERRGGFAQINAEAEDAVTRAEGGRGRGRVAREVGRRLTGGQTNQGRPETEPIIDRPTTDLDLERMQLEARGFRAAKPPRETTDLDLRNEADRLASAAVEKAIPGAAGQDGGWTSQRAQAFYMRSRAQHLSRLRKTGLEPAAPSPESVRLKEIADARRQADDILSGIAAMGDISPEEQRAQVAIEADARGITSEDAIKDATQALEARTAAAARSAATRDSKDPQTPDEARDRFKRAGGVIAGDSETIPPNARRRERTDVAAWHERLATLGMAGPGGGGGGGRPPAPPAGGPGGLDGISGPIHVIIDGQPVRVAWQGGAPSGTGISGREAAMAARDDATMARATARRMTSDQNLRFAETLVNRLRGEDKSDRQIKEALKFFGLGGAAALVIDDDGGGAGGSSGPRDVNARRARAGLGPVVARDEGFYRSVDAADQERARLAAEVRSAEKFLPKRGFQASVTDMLTNVGGFLDKQYEAISRFQRESTQYATILSRGPAVRGAADLAEETFRASEAALAEAKNKLEEAKASKASSREIKELSGSVKLLTKDVEIGGRIHEDAQRKLQEYNVELAQQDTRRAEARRALPGPVGRAGAFAVGGVAAAGAVAVGTIVAQLGQQMLAAVTEGLGPIAERLSGFGGTTGREQAGLAQQLRGSNDDIEGVLARRAIEARLSESQSALINQGLTSRTQGVAATQSLQQQFDLLNTSRSATAGMMGGFDRSLFRSTGGLFDVQLPGGPIQDISIGGQGSFAETLAGQVRTIKSAKDVARAGSPIPNFGPFSLGMDIGEALGGTPLGNAEDQIKATEDNTTQLKFLNDNLAGSDFRLAQTTDTEALARQEQMFTQAGVGSLGQALKDAGLTVEGINPQGNPMQEVGEFLDRFSRGPQMSPQQILDSTERERRAQAMLSEQQLNLRLQTGAQQGALGLARAGFGSTGGRAPTGRGGIAFSQRDDPKMVANLNKELDVTAGMYKEINDEVDAGVASMREFVSSTEANLSPKQVNDFNTALTKSLGYAKQISQIEIGLQTKQAAYAASQFTHQINIARRSLADAKGLVSGVGSNLGAIERQIFDLQRESQKLGLQQSQRQINFQRAVAGFQAPGLTSEEREARIQAAKMEADFAQKQLNIQKQLFGLQGRQFNMSASRAVQDLTSQLALLEEGREIVLETATAEKRIKALTALQEKENRKVEALYETAIQRTADVQKATIEIAVATGKGISQVANDVINAYVRTYRRMIREIYGSLPGGSQQSWQESPNPDRQERHALGAVGMVNGETSFGSLGVFGEAGGEAYAILRDPQKLFTPMQQSSSQQVIQIIVQGNKFSSEEDEDRIMRKITKAVEDAQGRKAALTGLRPFGG